MENIYTYEHVYEGNITFLSTGLIIYFCYGVRHSVQKQRLQRSHNQVNIHNITPNREQNWVPGQDFNI